MHYVCSGAITLYFHLYKTGCLMMQLILNLIKKTLGRPEIVNIICTQIPSFNFSKSPNRDCHSQETAYMVTTKNVTQTKICSFFKKHSS